MARLFAKNGYSVALIARGGDFVNKLATEINSSGGQAAPFTVPSYTHEAITSAWDAIHQNFPKPEYAIRAALFNVGYGVWKPFLDITPQEVQESLNTNVAAAFSFSRGAILAFKDNDIEEANGKRGALLFTGATASTRGNVLTSAFAAAKFGTRALSQSLAKEFNKQNIHVAHAIIDGPIKVDRPGQTTTSGPAGEFDASVRLEPDSIAAAYLYLVHQDRSA
ncbi:hypothetical protein NLJ89_g1258 [Agrocybe chaxingu]|uniref:NAD(P)-binding protein n=1 Tax=Agrocybe chaxingu TaxID=84603 RepID=A0A9W8N0I0_9AGAR|nr:hypothetical protein NLJ89_g1258 [Agrocybe chaxingu]